jgi:hypothetical protein
MKRLTMAGVLALAAVAALPLPARAADWRDASSAFRYGYDRGWRDGTEEGHRDGRRARDPRYWREDDFRDADSAYRRWMGPRVDYVKGYREGYGKGYRRAYAAARPEWRDRDWDRDRGSDRDRDDQRRRWSDDG